MRHTFTAIYKNIKIRPLESKDTEYLRKWRNNPNNSKYLRNIGYISEEQQKKWYQSYLKNTDEIAFSIDEIAELNELIGSASLYNFSGNQVEFGKILIGHDKAHNKKAGYNTAKAIIGLAFNKLSIDNVVLKCYKENVKALHIYTSLGFEKIGETKKENGYTEYNMILSKEQFFNKCGEDCKI